MTTKRLPRPVLLIAITLFVAVDAVIALLLWHHFRQDNSPAPVEARQPASPANQE